MTARIPFALVGVLLLVGSATFAGSLGQPTVAEPDVDRAMDRTEAATQSAVRDAVTEAATQAARNPVTVPAATEYGDVLDGGNAFRDALRVRVYVAVRDRLDRLNRTRDGVTVTASLPGTESGRALAAELDRVTVTRAGPNGTALRATVRNVTLSAHRGGSVVGTRTVSPTVTVPVPTLAVHDRVSRFERRLNAGPGEPGLGSRLTAKLYGLTWARGFAQYGGAPIENVVANRHLSLLTNGIALSMQREQFGRSDPRGRSVLDRAIAHTAITDTITGSDTRTANHLEKARQFAGTDTLPQEALAEAGTADPPVGPTDDVTIGVNRTADRAFVEMFDRLNDTIDGTYDARVQRRQRVVSTTESVVREPAEPDSDWDLLRTVRDRSESVSSRRADPPTLDGPWHLFAYHPRQVTARTTTVRYWNSSEGLRKTVGIREETADVDVVVVGRHDGGPSPQRPIETVHEVGGPLDGPNLKRVEPKAKSLLLTGRDIDELAAEGVRNDGVTATRTVTGSRPDGLYTYVYRDLRQFRERVRDIAVTATRGELATFRVNPGNRLAEKLRSEWDSLVGAPSAYDSVADRARYNARVAYLRTVLSRLEERGEKYERSRSEISEKLDKRDIPTLDALGTEYDSRGRKSSASDLGLQLRVETAPSYLTLGELDGAAVPTLPPNTTTHPLVAENVNYFTVPYGDVASGIVETFLGPKRVRLTTAVQTLQAAENASGLSGNGLTRTTETLETKVDRSNEYFGRRAMLAIEGVVPSAHGGSISLLSSALEPWDEPASRADAWANGSAVEAVHYEVTSQHDLSVVQSDKLRLSLRAMTAAGLNSGQAQPPLPAVNATANEIRATAKRKLDRKVGDTLSTVAKERLERATGRTLSRLPAGLPLAPPFLPWVTTVNYWSVQVRGEYTRFAVSVPRGTPETPGARFRYVRDSGAVSVDIDEDGTPERLGRTSRVSFRTHSSVSIAVPPGMRGVGDVDGVMFERSAGWPRPG